jgi:hypothetical protein
MLSLQTTSTFDKQVRLGTYEAANNLCTTLRQYILKATAISLGVILLVGLVITASLHFSGKMNLFTLSCGGYILGVAIGILFAATISILREKRGSRAVHHLDITWAWRILSGLFVAGLIATGVATGVMPKLQVIAKGIFTTRGLIGFIPGLISTIGIIFFIDHHRAKFLPQQRKPSISSDLERYRQQSNSNLLPGSVAPAKAAAPSVSPIAASPDPMPSALDDPPPVEGYPSDVRMGDDLN